jgi:hypothetical protein
MHRRRPSRVRPARALFLALCLMAGSVLGLLATSLAARQAQAQPGLDTISGLYIHESEPRASLKLLLAPSEKDGQPVGRVWGVVSYKDPRNKADSCLFEFQSTLKSDTITCRDAMNPGCAIRLRLVDRTVILDTEPQCLTVYCKGRGRVMEGIYVRTTKGAKKSRLP